MARPLMTDEIDQPVYNNRLEHIWFGDSVSLSRTLSGLQSGTTLETVDFIIKEFLDDDDPLVTVTVTFFESAAGLITDVGSSGIAAYYINLAKSDIDSILDRNKPYLYFFVAKNQAGSPSVVENGSIVFAQGVA